MARSQFALAVVAAAAVAVGPVALAEDKDRGPEARDQVRNVILELKIKLAEVGTTYDACDKGNTVAFFGRENGAGDFGKVTVKPGDLKLIEMVATAKELRWYCGGSRQGVANDRDFDWVQIERAGNGAITWKFFKQQ